MKVPNVIGALAGTFWLAALVVLAGCERPVEEANDRAHLSSHERQLLGPKLDERSGGFSYYIPRNWEIIDVEDSAYRVAIGPRRNGYLANIRVSRESAQVNFSYYLQLARRELGEQFMSTGVEEDDSFTTVAGVKGRRWITHTLQAGERVWHAHYLFPGPGNVKFVVSASATQSDARKVAEMSDAAVKTLIIR